MWLLNYCSPFLYNSSGATASIRYVMYSCLALLFLVYAVYISIYKLIASK